MVQYYQQYYQQVKQELTDLVYWIRNGERTLEDAVEKLREAREKLKEPIDIQREKLKAELKERRNELINLISNYTGLEDREAIKRLAEEKSQGFPWLSQAYADYFYLQDLILADYLETKPHPALETANEIRREIASRRRIAEQLYRVLKYKLEYYEKLFPWLVDFGEEGIDDLIRQTIEKQQKGGEEIEEPDDPVKKWLTLAEYARLPTVERNQRALDRYWQKPKAKWEIGRDYERYIGYTYESKGWTVHYQGIIEGFADLGRDLIVIKGNDIEIIQCKYWSQEKSIHEKHVFQLFGTTVEYWVKNMAKQNTGQPSRFPELLRQDRIKPKFITSTKLSEKAREFAEVLQVHVEENFPLKHYPCIKCNISMRNSEKIYHLPFDQQYDRTIIEDERNECYVETVKQAEDLGFRRAFRWRGMADTSEPKPLSSNP